MTTTDFFESAQLALRAFFAEQGLISLGTCAEGALVEELLEDLGALHLGRALGLPGFGPRPPPPDDALREGIKRFVLRHGRRRLEAERRDELRRARALESEAQLRDYLDTAVVKFQRLRGRYPWRFGAIPHDVSDDDLAQELKVDLIAALQTHGFAAYEGIGVEATVKCMLRTRDRLRERRGSHWLDCPSLQPNRPPTPEQLLVRRQADGMAQRLDPVLRRELRPAQWTAWEALKGTLWSTSRWRFNASEAAAKLGRSHTTLSRHEASIRQTLDALGARDWIGETS